MSAQASSDFKNEIWQLINLDHGLIACGGFKKKTFLCEFSTQESERLRLLHRPKHSTDKLSPASSVHAPPWWMVDYSSRCYYLRSLPFIPSSTAASTRWCDTHLPSTSASPFVSHHRGLEARSRRFAVSPQDGIRNASF